MDSVAHRCDGHMHIHRRLCLEEETEVSRGTGSHQELFLLVSSTEASSLSVLHLSNTYQAKHMENWFFF